MYPTLLDIKTGKTVTAKDSESSVFWWTEGNGSCDCNRAAEFDDDIYDEIAQQFEENVCFGCHRIVAIDAHGDLESCSKEDVLEWMNDGYPDNLRKYWVKK